ncbi:MAG: polysaccharide pyruvyl transferase family protein, partial [Lachnospiraceae bacterium]|nr:polysaccharide pyruvyl transferase family protein [Lachnospiraceae bacterium]
ILYFCIGFPMDSTITFAKELARKAHKKLLLLMDKDIPYKYVTISHLKEVDPMLFISYIYYADCIVTNSFHATAFSILFHKEFYVETVVKRRERILNLLNLTGMNDRGLENGKATNTQVSTNWQSVDNKLQPWIDDSIDYLKFITTGL